MDQLAAPRSLRPILLVEDDASLRAAMIFALQAEGFVVFGFADGEHLLRSRPAGEIGCLVVDLQLPGLNGLDLISYLRAGGESAPAILITTKPAARHRQEALAAGVDIVEKPLLDSELGQRIRRAMGAEDPLRHNPGIN